MFSILDSGRTVEKNSIRNWTIKSPDSIYHNLLKHDGKIIDTAVATLKSLNIDIAHLEWIALPQFLVSGMVGRVRAGQIHKLIKLYNHSSKSRSSTGKDATRLELFGSV